jgi:hypothetical protein
MKKYKKISQCSKLKLNPTAKYTKMKNKSYLDFLSTFLSSPSSQSSQTRNTKKAQTKQNGYVKMLVSPLVNQFFYRI